MVADFAEADLVLCRAGATTTAELIAAGKASIMVPFPQAADDHQRKNAEALQAAGAARMILQHELSGEQLANEIEKLVQAPQELDQMEEASRKLAHGDAAAAAVDMIEELSHKKAQRAQK
jgi:UDP-N-acetylglucosamine--N-acetylmuramyl-(pentapeptide) pyrophosphoryl-undecaprenol N-acetylglucosamine transferase